MAAVRRRLSEEKKYGWIKDQFINTVANFQPSISFLSAPKSLWWSSVFDFWQNRPAQNTLLSMMNNVS